jgi:hypothetical protein
VPPTNQKTEGTFQVRAKTLKWTALLFVKIGTAVHVLIEHTR